MIGLTIIFIILLYLYLAYKVVKYVASKTEKNIYWILTVLFFILLPTWDVIIGKIYFHHLCQTEGGLRVFKSVEVDGVLTENSIAMGDSSFYKKRGFKYIEGVSSDLKNHKIIQHLDLTDANQTIQIIKEPQSRYMFIYNERSRPVKWLPIVKNRALVKDRITNEVFGEDIGFNYFGSWIGIIADHLVSGVSNPTQKCTNDPYRLLKQTLKPKNNEGVNNGK